MTDFTIFAAILLVTFCLLVFLCQKPEVARPPEVRQGLTCGQPYQIMSVQPRGWMVSPGAGPVRRVNTADGYADCDKVFILEPAGASYLIWGSKGWWTHSPATPDVLITTRDRSDLRARFTIRRQDTGVYTIVNNAGYQVVAEPGGYALRRVNPGGHTGRDYYSDQGFQFKKIENL